MKLLVWVFLLVVCVSGAVAQSNIPTFRAKQFVYRVPADFDPPMVGDSGIDELEQLAKSLRYHHYLVFMRRLPDTSSSTVEDAERTAEAIQAAWQGRGYDKSRDILTLIAYGPGSKQTFLLPSTDIRVKMGFERDRVTEFLTDNFLPYAKRSNPKEGLVQTMRLLDQLVYDRTDPEQIARRQLQGAKSQLAAETSRLRQLLSSPAEVMPSDVREYRTVLANADSNSSNASLTALQERRDVVARAANELSGLITAKQQEAEKYRHAAVEIHSLTHDLDTMLSSPGKYLPNNLSEYNMALEHARIVRDGTDRNAIVTEVDALRPTVEKLKAFYDQQQAVEAQQIQSANNKRLIELAALIALIVGTIGRIVNLSGRKKRFADRIARERERLQNASDKALAFDEESQGYVSLFKDTTSGKTQALYASTAPALFDIFVGLEAASDHLARMESLAKRANFFNFGPIKAADAQLEREFDFDTGKVDNELVAPRTEIVHLTLNQIFKNLSDQYDALLANWQLLKDAAQAATVTPQQALPGTEFDQLSAKANGLGIPLVWLNRHPLAQDDASDRLFYDHLEQLRQSDPVSYLEQVRAAHQKTSELLATLDRIVAAQQLGVRHRVDQAPELPDTIVAPDDDPRQTFLAARAEEQLFAALIAGATDLSAAEASAQKIDALYQSLQSQQSQIKNAIRDASQAIITAQQLLGEVVAKEIKATAKLETAKEIYTNTQEAQTALDSAISYRRAAEGDLLHAQQRLSDKQHLAASREAQHAIDSLRAALEQQGSSMTACVRLDQARREYEQKLAQMEAFRQNAADRIRHYGGTPSVMQSFVQPSLGNRNDFYRLLGMLSGYEDAWNQNITAARQQYEIEREMERQRREEERRRAESRRQAAAAAASSRSNDIFSGGGGGGVSWDSSSSNSSSSSSSGGGGGVSW